MKIVMVSNYFNHHQRPVAEVLYRMSGGNYHFIETTTMRQERKNLGYDNGNTPAYVLQAWTDAQSDAHCRRLIDEADVVITGSAPESMLKNRILAGKLIFRYSERPLKKGPEWKKYLPRLLRWHLRNPSGKPIYLLCAGAYVADDYRRFGLFRDRMYRWGYFPETKKYETLPEKEGASILWCGRFLDWKHPDDAIRVAGRLRAEGYRFRLNFVGTGEMEQQLRGLAEELGLADQVRFLGAMPPEEVRRQMEHTQIYLFTSDRQEGWGAVLNEAMNSGCAVVASHAAGSAPFLIEDGRTGLLYRSGDVDMLYKKVKRLLDSSEECQRLGTAAYNVIDSQWCPELAAQRLVRLAECILSGQERPELYESGPCSKALRIREDWYQG